MFIEIQIELCWTCRHSLDSSYQRGWCSWAQHCSLAVWASFCIRLSHQRSTDIKWIKSGGHFERKQLCQDKTCWGWDIQATHLQAWDGWRISDLLSMPAGSNLQQLHSWNSLASYRVRIFHLWSLRSWGIWRMKNACLVSFRKNIQSWEFRFELP